MTEYTAPCVGGPCEGSKYPYELIDGQAHPKEYLVYDYWMTGDSILLGKYEFIHSGHERRGTGDTWRWHPFIGSIK